jgi:glycosyltransferase involved in cell wall biosynthesis
MGQTFLDLGYALDVIQWNSKYLPVKEYSVLVDSRFNMHRFAPLLGPDCVKVLHIEAAHWLFHMTALHNRYQDLQRRRGVSLAMRKLAPPNWAIEATDYATTCGNEFTMGTFRYANKPIYRVPHSTQTQYPWFDGKDFDACRKTFLWFGGTGLVHKGLDRVLEAFAEMPSYDLYICGPVESEPDFVREYRRELYETRNITVVGWVDVSSEAFLEILRKSIAQVYASCSEGMCGSVVNCLHGGLIPIISYESGVDVGDFGEILRTCSVEEIKAAVQTVAQLPGSELERRSRAAWEYARSNHTREKFAAGYRQAVEQILAASGR